MRETVKVYVPKFFIRRCTRRVLKNREKYRDLEKALVSARLPLNVQELLAIASFYSIISFFIGLMLGMIIVLTTSPTLLLYIASYTPFYNYVSENYYLIRKVYPAIAIIFGLIAYKLTSYSILSYPFFLAKRRRNEIELYLPHAISMMYSMATGGIPIHNMIRTVAESKHIFGELSREFMIIVEMVDVFKRNIYDGMRFVRDTTPSPQLSSFLDNMIFILEGGGRLSEFLRRKSEELSEERERTFESFIELLGMMAEVYIALFVVLPLFLLIVLSVTRILGTPFEIYRIILIVTLPVATFMFMYIIRSIIPLPKVKLEEFERRYELVKANVVEGFRDSFTIDRIKRFKKKILRLLLHPFKERIYDINLKVVLFHVTLASIVVFLISLRYLRLEHTLLLAISAFVIPLIILVEIKERVMRKTEERIPDVFSELAMLNEAGLTVLEGLRVLSQTEMGLLTREIAVMRREIEWGVLIPRAFIRLGIRVKSDILSKIVPVVVKALETAPTIKDAFNVVARYADTEVAFKKRMRSSTLLYVIIIYMCIVVFLTTTYMIITSFFKPFVGLSGVSVGGYALSFDVEYIKNSFLQVAMMVGVLSGLVAGQIGEGNALLGLKHSYIFTIMTYMVFNLM
ncbi:type II secretion system F family protein [Archaeoglobus profundus]|uniref:Type II secretion system protein n=1 Tax=Archaeoglobus profundus (strain DSM 5631 / JCM 9629 / NBRC 100127 / Av18) TaxID=572546 RepID=D2RE19_ARCPA|nr:type II secretion system F family protein [Archaeoglobus profundus]ADB58363.1 type II secretion system protein [Archaeoglobus profundus DSM 5631]